MVSDYVTALLLDPVTIFVERVRVTIDISEIKKFIRHIFDPNQNPETPSTSILQLVE